MRRWLLPLLAGVVVAWAAYYAALVAAPRVLMAAAIKRVGVAGTNRMSFPPLATDRARAVVRASPDLAYASCPFDLSDGPVAVHVAPAPARYWSLSVFDARTDAALVRNALQTGGKAIDVVIALPGQRVPAGRDVVRVDGGKGIALVRILVENRAAFAPLDVARRRSSCRPL